ncbi:MAG: 2-oxoglutarate dehydrogenase complex dihydrolipoyllysine-residue succinyltransferase [Bacteroidia bacterium]|nr:MAG: 2-oxoglutarate dehydrogenase complex dihydrolipoyllysine-residue succinyltransferase [Bacteroidia bacterium]
MALEIKIPSPGESITEVELTSWFVEDGALVTKNQEIGEIESEKATLPLIATQAGQIKILVKEGETLQVGVVVATIDTSVKVPNAPAQTRNTVTPAAAAVISTNSAPLTTPETRSSLEAVKATPVAKQMMDKEGLSVDDIVSGLKKISANDVKQVIAHRASSGILQRQQEASRDEERKKVSQLRKKISERLVAVRNETAMLTTFNEADMSAIMAIRAKYQEQFVAKHGIKIGFMSFFTKAVTEALKQFPSVNSYLDGEEVVSPKYCDIGIAVQTDKGLMVPVVKNAEILSLADIEKKIADLAGRARIARLSIEEMSGGTFTISNGGIYGSMLSTPILNPPQSGILGMHNILERPVAIKGKVEIRPMMYIALSYDHRVIDGKDSVSFLLAVKELLEEPARMIFGEQSPEQFLLDI